MTKTWEVFQCLSDILHTDLFQQHMCFCTNNMPAASANITNDSPCCQCLNNSHSAIEFAATAEHDLTNYKWNLALLKDDIVGHLYLCFSQKCQMSQQVFTASCVEQFLHKIAIVDE